MKKFKIISLVFFYISIGIFVFIARDLFYFFFVPAIFGGDPYKIDIGKWLESANESFIPIIIMLITITIAWIFRMLYFMRKVKESNKNKS